MDCIYTFTFYFPHFTDSNAPGSFIILNGTGGIQEQSDDRSQKGTTSSSLSSVEVSNLPSLCLSCDSNGWPSSLPPQESPVTGTVKSSTCSHNHPTTACAVAIFLSSGPCSSTNKHLYLSHFLKNFLLTPRIPQGTTSFLHSAFTQNSSKGMLTSHSPSTQAFVPTFH